MRSFAWVPASRAAQLRTVTPPGRLAACLMRSSIPFPAALLLL